ncbi:hypothetical protein H4R99_008576 [Coemansia sp. RSA 1722]|nr:hypothetical protein H4R99_008576 [Coemansia sp. RSA 1722]KAJ2595996.1 hypothetical protein GGF39_003620 [Coemansia sp. RSA 1721]
MAAAVGFWLFSSKFLRMHSFLLDHSAVSVLLLATAKETKANSSKTDTRSSISKNNTAAHDSFYDWYPAKFNHAMVLVVDALRMDFATQSNNLSASELPQNASSSSGQTMVAHRLRGSV